MMDDERRERLNLRAIRVSMASAMRGLTAEQAARTLERANLLLDQARRAATTDAVRHDIDRLQRELDDRFGRLAGDTSG